MIESGNTTVRLQSTGSKKRESACGKNQHSPGNVSDWSSKKSKESSGNKAELKHEQFLNTESLSGTQERKRNQEWQRVSDTAEPLGGALEAVQSNKSTDRPRVDNYSRRERRDQVVKRHDQRELSIDACESLSSAHADTNESNQVTVSSSQQRRGIKQIQKLSIASLLPNTVIIGSATIQTIFSALSMSIDK